MENLAQYITTYAGMHLNVFLVVDNGITYLICYQPGHTFGYMCPCCMLDDHREAITKVLVKMLEEQKISSEITWCCYKSFVPRMGYTANGYFPELTEAGIKFIGGSADNITSETIEALNRKIDELYQ